MVKAKFTFQTPQKVNASFSIGQRQSVDAGFSADIKGTHDHDALFNRDLPDQHPIEAITNLENVLSGLTNGVSTLQETIGNFGDVVTHNTDYFATAEQGALADSALQSGDNITELVNNAGYVKEGVVNFKFNTLKEIIDGYGDIVTHNVDEFATAEQGQLADTALQSGDNISELTNNVHYATESFVEDKIEDVTDTFGDIVTHNVSEFATSAQGDLADTALQPNDNISELNNDVGYITSASLPTVNNGTLTIQKNGSDLGTFTANQATNTTVNVVVPTQASDINALPDTTTIADLTTTAQLNALNSGATTTNIGQITTNENDISDINDKIPSQASSSNQLADKDFVNSSIATNTAKFIGTFANVTDLESYAGTVTNNDYAFVINSVIEDNGRDWSSFSDLDNYDKSLLTNFDYGWVINGANFDLYRFDIVDQSWDLRASDISKTSVTLNTAYNRYKATVISNVTTWDYEYTLNNSSFTASQWATINSGATSADVALAQSALQPNDNVSELVNDAGYITSASLPTVNDATLTIQKNGTSVGTFTANASSNVTANITVPTDTGDLTNGAGYITGITSGDVTTALGYTPYDSSNPSGYISGITSGDVTTALGYTPYNSSNPSGYITATALNGYATQTWVGQQGYLTSISSSDVTSALGYTPADNSDVSAIQANYVTTNTAQTISARKTFGDRIQRSSNIDQTSTTGSVEIQSFNVMDKDNNSVSMLNTARSSTRNYQSMRAYNTNVTGGNWMDIRVNVQDDGIGYVNIDKGASVENRNLTKSTSSKTDTYVATMGWVNNGSKSTNIVHRDGTETITGNKNFTGDLTAVTQTAGDNSAKVATTAYVGNKFQVVASLPATPDADTFYFIQE